MDIEFLRSLTEIIDHSDLTLIEISGTGSTIRLERKREQMAIDASPVYLEPTFQSIEANDSSDDVDFKKITEVKSPFVGIFYASEKEDASPLVKIGDKVKKGDLLCIIESMKLKHKITAEKDGEIIDVCATNGQIVEYSQILFKIF